MIEIYFVVTKLSKQCFTFLAAIFGGHLGFYILVVKSLILIIM